jgi:hypothetical protein
MDNGKGESRSKGKDSSKGKKQKRLRCGGWSSSYIPPIAKCAMDGAPGLLAGGRETKDRSRSLIRLRSGRLFGDDNQEGKRQKQRQLKLTL